MFLRSVQPSTETPLCGRSRDLKNIVHFYRLNTPRHGRGRWLEVTEFSTRGGSNNKIKRRSDLTVNE
ncbi:hypothetical protein D6D04_01342 [Aureobasidium pullulans]|nr:hypothetical protein D6D04_01342 [Aureobasidium pullulans]